MDELLAGEPADTDDADEARRWIAVYAELTSWLERMLIEDDMAVELRARLAWRLLRLRARLEFWVSHQPGAGSPAARALVTVLPDLDLDEPLADGVENRL